jgi:hypothetical protein
MHRLWRWYVLWTRRCNRVYDMSQQFKFANFKHCGYRLCLQRRLHRTEWEYMQCMCCWEIHRYNWNHGMHSLWRWNIRCRDWCDGVHDMSHQFKFASFQSGSYRLHLQRRLQRTEWGYMQCMRDWEIQEYTWKFDMHRLCRWYVLRGRGCKCVHDMSCLCQFAQPQHGRD